MANSVDLNGEEMIMDIFIDHDGNSLNEEETAEALDELLADVARQVPELLEMLLNPASSQNEAHRTMIESAEYVYRKYGPVKAAAMIIDSFMGDTEHVSVQTVKIAAVQSTFLALRAKIEGAS